jgi:predicted DNA-binding protein YlxM (UPF0122 family)
MSTFSHLRRTKTFYQRENNDFLIKTCKSVRNRFGIINWKVVAKFYNQKFDDHKTSKQLKKHFDCISGELRTGALSQEEVKTFERLIHEGKSLSEIAKEMKREDSSIKNHFKRKFKNEEKYPKEEFSEQFSEEIKIFQEIGSNDFILFDK